VVACPPPALGGTQQGRLQQVLRVAPVTDQEHGQPEQRRGPVEHELLVRGFEVVVHNPVNDGPEH
jgi:hypothetical protein